MPYLKNENFTEVRSDRRNETVYSFVRRPGYYAIINTGKIITDQQRYGIGLIWNPTMGTVIQSQSKSDIGAWGTRGIDKDKVYEASDVMATLFADDKEWVPAPGINSVDGMFSLTYPLGSSGNKKITFTDSGIGVEIRHKGLFTEVIPVLVDADASLSTDNRTIELHDSEGHRMTIDIESPLEVALLNDSIDTHGGKLCRVIEIKGKERLNYSISFNK